MKKISKQTTYKGVCWKPKENRWIATITYKGKKIGCGSATTDVDAVKLRDRKIMALGLPTKLLQVFKPIEKLKRNNLT